MFRYIKRHLFVISIVMMQLCAAAYARQDLINVCDYGAVVDGKTLNTKAIQSALNACASRGGGTVYFPAGEYATGTLRIGNNTLLHLDPGAVIAAAPSLSDFPAITVPFKTYLEPYFRHSLIYAEKAVNIGISGKGIIDGRGADPAFARRSSNPPERYMYRPSVIRFVECSKVTIRDVTIKNSAFWCTHYLACDNVVIDGITVDSRSPNYNTDGIDIDSCANVRISNCLVNSEDDAIALKSTSERCNRGITITNCCLTSHCSGVRIGPESLGGHEDITVTNCTIYDTQQSAIQVQTFDGGNIDRVCVSNITLRNVGHGIFINNGSELFGLPKENSFMAKPGVGRVRNISISDIRGTGIGIYNGIGPVNSLKSAKRRLGCIISGSPEMYVEDITLSNIRLSYNGMGTLKDGQRSFLGKPNGINCGAYDDTPGYALYARYAKNLRIHNTDFTYENDDFRPAVVMENVDDADIFAMKYRLHPDARSAILFRNMNGAYIHGMPVEPSQRSRVLLLDGDSNKNVLFDSTIR